MMRYRHDFIYDTNPFVYLQKCQVVLPATVARACTVHVLMMEPLIHVHVMMGGQGQNVIQVTLRSCTKIVFICKSKLLVQLT